MNAVWTKRRSSVTRRPTPRLSLIQKRTTSSSHKLGWLASLVMTEGSTDTQSSKQNQQYKRWSQLLSHYLRQNLTIISTIQKIHFSLLKQLISSRLNWKSLTQRPARICIHFLSTLSRDKVTSVKWISSRTKIAEGPITPWKSSIWSPSALCAEPVPLLFQENVVHGSASIFLA